jgi:hypothetical protein
MLKMERVCLFETSVNFCQAEVASEKIMLLSIYCNFIPNVTRISICSDGLQKGLGFGMQQGQEFLLFSILPK